MKVLMFMAGSVIRKSDFFVRENVLAHFGMAWWKLFSY